jgi:hypothetical protein
MRHTGFLKIASVTAIAAAGIAVASTPATAKSHCKAKHEKSKCALAKKFEYANTRTASTYFVLDVKYKSKSSFTAFLAPNAVVRCSKGLQANGTTTIGGETLTFKKKAVVGKTYHGSDLESGPRATVSLKVKVKFTSAKHASAALAYSVKFPNSHGGQDLVCQGSDTIKLKRAN